MREIKFEIFYLKTIFDGLVYTEELIPRGRQFDTKEEALDFAGESDEGERVVILEVIT